MSEEHEEHETAILWGERTLPAFFDLLEEEHPLRWREIHVDAGSDTRNLIHVCGAGHVHLYISPTSNQASATILGLFAYTFALILDTKPNAPKRPGKKVIEDRIGLVLDVLHSDPMIAALYMANVGTLMEWLKDYTDERSTKRLELPEVLRRRRPARAAVEVGEVGQAVQAPVQAAQRTQIGDPSLDGVNLGASQLVETPFGSMIVGILGYPFELGEG